MRTPASCKILLRKKGGMDGEENKHYNEEQ
jgi:hypothetical protein